MMQKEKLLKRLKKTEAEIVSREAEILKYISEDKYKPSRLFALGAMYRMDLECKANILKLLSDLESKETICKK